MWYAVLVITAKIENIEKQKLRYVPEWVTISHPGYY